ncbi:S-layer homology domain-containing protein [Vallitalea maricola]|uniref:Uncharacterized protein n=1 Tax=Vallitalea maricola TaxID=3074433 RepID=A0ACB5UGJ1_9FIRM|nr:hypothetical protein AN2V17_12120 [Vallitalea sp. AN17-2]
MYLITKISYKEKMKKRILSIFLTLCMVLSLLPMTAFAADIPDGYANGDSVSSTGFYLDSDIPTENTAYIAGDGYVLWEPTVDTESNVTGGTVTLHDATIASSLKALYLPSVPITIEVEGTNALTAKKEGIYHESGALVIEGSGTLSVETSGYIGIYQRADDLTITGDVTVSASALGTNSNGIRCAPLTICDNASVTASGTLRDLNANGDVTINTTGATIMSKYIKADTVTVTDGTTLTIPEGKPLTLEIGTMIINNGIINFPNGITATEITKLNLTGSGKIQIDGSDAVLIGDDLYTGVTDVSDKGLDLSTGTPTTATSYLAGDGQILWVPADGDTPATLTLNNATIDTTSNSLDVSAIHLPEIPVTIEVTGTNNLASSVYAILNNNADITIEGDGTLNFEESGGSASGIYCGSLTVTGDVSLFGDCVDQDFYCMDSIMIDTTGTVDAPEIRDYGTFTYMQGTMVGSLVTELKGDYTNYNLCYVYGDVELSEDFNVMAANIEDGLTITAGATLTIDEGVTLTVQDGTEITNNGTIVNNGTFNFPVGTTVAEISALNLTGNGSVQLDGTTVLVVDGEFYTSAGDISNSTLDLSTNTPTTAAVYTSGDGYVLWDPTVDGDSNVTSGMLTLHNATMEASVYQSLITLPTVDVTVELEGENSLTNTADAEDIITIIEQGRIVVIDNDNPEKQTPQTYTLTFSGDGTLETETNAKIGISTDGTLIIASSGNIDLVSVNTVDFLMERGYLESSLASAGDMVINGGTIYARESVCVGDFSMTGGTVTFDSLESFGLRCLGMVTHTGGTLTASILNVDIATYTITYHIYGDVTLSNEIMPAGTTQYSTKYVVRIMNGSSLTIDSDAVLYTAGNVSGFTMSDVTADNIGEYIVNDGTLVNNGVILLPNGLTDAEVKTIAQNVLKSPSGSGKIQVYDGVDGTNNTIYSNSGERMTLILGNLDLTSGEHSSATLADDGYTWTGNSTDGYTLTLGGTYLDGDLTLPDNSPVEIHTTASSVINGAIQGAGSYAICFTLTGTAPLTIYGDISNFVNGDKVTIQDGVQVTINGFISIGASGTDGTLVVTGRGTTLSIPSTGAYAIGCDTVRVEGGAMLNVSAENCSIHTLDGGVSVTDGSTLKVGCDYGVYIEDGTFTVDDSSTFTASASTAAVCVVDTSTTKSQSETLNVSSTLLPSGAEIASAIGDTSGYGYTYWSIVTSGNTLSATNENSTPATLSNAVGELKLKKTSSSDGGSSSGGSSSGGSSSTTSYTITATAGENGSISASGKVSVVRNSDKSFTITPDSGYTVSDVLVDGVSVGAVSSYTFERVTKNHIITVSFIKKAKITGYNDVKDSSWFKEAVDFVTEKGLMTGTGNGKFSPFLSTDRGMIVIILWRLEGRPEASSDACFSDVTEGKYYADAVNWGAENDIVKGYGNGNFGPTDTITREQMAAILYRYSQFKGYDTTQGDMPVREFSDYDMISAWALESVTWSVNAKLMSGKDNNVIDARGEATRAEVATILMHFCQNVTK